ncbi:hypothetical protein A2U01_0114229, partial [Trifolium medium]|nr:hypothetical protein [Trifolium medium]
MRMEKILLGGENPPCVPHRFPDGDLVIANGGGNNKSCDKHDRLPVEGFLRSVNL